MTRQRTSQNQSTERLRQINRLYRFLLQANRTVVRSEDRATLFQAICDMAVACGRFRMTWIGLIDDSDGMVNPFAHAGHEEGYLREILITANYSPFGRGPTGSAIQEGRLVICEDIATDPRMLPWRDKALARGYRSSAAVPIRCRGRVIGGLSLYAAEQGFFTEDERELLEEIGTDISHALDAMETEKERKESAAALAVSEERYRRFSALTSDYVHFCTRRGGSPYRVQWLGGAVEEITGYSEQEILDWGCWLHLLHPDDRERFCATLMELKPGDTCAEEFRLFARDGTTHWVRQICRCEAGDTPDELRLFGASRNITDHKRLEEALLVSQKMLCEAQQLGHLGSWRRDLVTGELIWSDETYRIFDWPPGTPLDYDQFMERIHPDDTTRLRAAQTEAFAGRAPLDIDYRIIRPDGTVRHLHEKSSALHNAEGRLIALEGMVQDITDRKEAEEALRQLNEELDRRVAGRTAQLEAAIREQESFSYSVSHDLRAPLRHINSYSAMIAEDFGEQLPPEACRYLERIGTASARMGQLIDDLLELSRVGRAEIHHQTVNLSREAARVAAMLRETEPDRTMAWVIADGLRARGDATLLRQLLENLLGNAWKYTAREPQARIEFGKTVVEGEEAFFVRDNGVGFDMAYKHKLFGPFQRLHGSEFQGTGIGLATVQRIIERHGGKVWAESSLNGGATFYFTLPDDEGPTAAPA